MRMYKETAVRLVPKEHHQILKDDNGFVRHIVHDISEDLAERVMAILEEEKEIVVRQFDLRVEEQKMLHRVEYRQNIMWTPLVRCKDCALCSIGANEGGKWCWCLHWSNSIEPTDFCSYGMRKDSDEYEAL